MLPLCAGDKLTDAGLHRLEQVLGDEDFEQVAAAWAVKEHLHRIPPAKDTAAAQNARIDFETAVAAADMDEIETLAATVAKWWTEIKVFIRTKIANARTELANTGNKQIKRTSRGLRDQYNYQSHILGTSIRQTRRRRRIPHQHGLHTQP